MASADQLKALIRSHAEGDDTRFFSVALQVAAAEANGGHARLANELRDLVDKSRQRRQQRTAQPTPIAQPRGELAALLRASYADLRLHDLVLAPEAMSRLHRITDEQRQREALASHGFQAARKVLLSGPPGTGKTMTASALAGELGMPLFLVRLDALVTKFLGETSVKLRLIFEAMAQTRGVYLFDEFDAYAGERGGGNDVGEMRRVVNSFLMMLEQDTSYSLVLAATNHPELIDSAMFRRFDAVLTYALPSAEAAESIMRGRLAALSTRMVAWPDVVTAAAGLSQADVVRACEDAAKGAILVGDHEVTTAMLQGALADRRTLRR